MNRYEEETLSLLQEIKQQQEQIIFLLKEQLYLSCCTRNDQYDPAYAQDRAALLKKELDQHWLSVAMDISNVAAEQ